MPTGHTTKKTMTAYRATLLRRLLDGPVARRTVSAAERRQFNDCCLFGWANDDGANYTLTDTGRAKLDAFQRTLVPGSGGCDDGRLAEGGCAADRGLITPGPSRVSESVIPASSPRRSGRLTPPGSQISSDAICAPSASMIDDAITFGQRGQIRRGDIRVGWIEKCDDALPTRWRLMLTPASGRPGIKGEFTRRKDARAEALHLLGAMNQPSRRRL